MTASARAAAEAATPSHGVGPIVVLGERIKHALRRRAGRLRVALLVFVLLLPLFGGVAGLDNHYAFVMANSRDAITVYLSRVLVHRLEPDIRKLTSTEPTAGEHQRTDQREVADVPNGGGRRDHRRVRLTSEGP